MKKFKDITGQKFNRLTVISFAKRTKISYLWNCLCDCGNTSIVNGGSLKNNSIKSCGCLQKEVLMKRNMKHGLARSSEYMIWSSMKARCLNSNNHAYKDYGGRGITICDEWLNFENFINDMGLRPSKNYSIDRINNDLGYHKENCRWSTKKEQGNNKRTNIPVINTETGIIYSTISNAADSLNMNKTTLYNQLYGVYRNKTKLQLLNI